MSNVFGLVSVDIYLNRIYYCYFFAETYINKLKIQMYKKS